MGYRVARERARRKRLLWRVLGWAIQREAAWHLLGGDARFPDEDTRRAWLGVVSLASVRRALRTAGAENARAPYLFTPELAAHVRAQLHHEGRISGERARQLKALAREQRRELREDGYNSARRWYERPGALGRP